MMDIVLKQAAHSRNDAITVTGQIDFGSSFGGAKFTVFAKGERKSEVVESVIKKMDTMINFINDAKETIGKI